MIQSGLPKQTGLYDPSFEHDACGVGFVADLKGRKTHEIVRMGLKLLVNLTHRGAAGADPLTGDGAGILIQMPDAMLRQACRTLHIDLPELGAYGVGMVFLPKETSIRESIQRHIEKLIMDEEQVVLGWRDVPINKGARIGYTAKETEPLVRQVIVAARNKPADADPNWLERKLYIIRQRIENTVRDYGMEELSSFDVPSFSSRTLLYKGMFLADQVEDYYLDLVNPAVVSGFSLVHQRYSTNTFPTWGLAQPFRMIAHNGEINTVRGNINWMRAREAALTHPHFGDDLKKLFPVIPEGLSDSAAFDRAVEFLVLSGRSLPHAMMMLIPEAWENHKQMGDELKGFYEYHASIMEPWDGPAAVAFTDGRIIGATLDRNGLRPARYQVTKSGLCVMASEAGTVTFPPEEVLYNGRLQPGRMFVIDLEEGRIIDDTEVKKQILEGKPYRQWVEDGLINLDDMEEGDSTKEEQEKLGTLHKIFGYTEEDLHLLMGPMALGGSEPIGSMGNDAALAVLSTKNKPLFSYFKQLFAQVTNPPIDPIREDLVMSLYNQLGPAGNLLEESPEHVNHIRLLQPVIDNKQLEKIRAANVKGLHARTFSTLFLVERQCSLDDILSRLFDEVSTAVEDGVNLIILSDRGANKKQAPLPILLAAAGLHHHLIRAGTRSKVSIIVESAEVREVFHFALLVGYGTSAVNPYLAISTLSDLCGKGLFPPEITPAVAFKNYAKAVNKGLLKISSKMGISTLKSYSGAQIFEAVGLAKSLVSRYFTGTVSRIEGVDMTTLKEEILRKHRLAYAENVISINQLEVGGEYKYRHGGESHLWTPENIAKLQHSTRENNYETYKAFARTINEQSKNLCTLRSLLRLKKAAQPVPLDEVEPASEIVRRFVTGAMSYGSISKEAHETLAIAMNRIGGMSNTGEGGEDPERFKPRPNGDNARSAIKQVASGRFGVSSHYLVNSDEMQIKIAQGAKPGEGGQLPGHKVNEVIARTRNTTPGVTLISPPPHHDIYSIEDLAQLIFDLKNVNPDGRVSVKLVSEVGVGTVAAGVSKAHADMILIAGHDGGTGASPVSSIKHAGVPWELGLAETQQTLVLNDLRGRVRLQVDGQLRTGRDVIIGALLGAEEFGFATGPLVVEGCIMMRKCHLGTCPVGIATQDLELRKKFTGQPQHVVNYFFFIANEVRERMAAMGFRKMDDMIGRVDRLEAREAIDHFKAQGLDFTNILKQPDVPSRIATRYVQPQDHGIDKVLDHKLLELAGIAFETREPIQIHLPIHNTDRSVGAMLGGEISKRFGGEGLPDNTIQCHFTGVAGQSFGCFNVAGVSLHLTGAANDYVCKGMSGGRVVVKPHPGATFVAEENIIAGNTILYGAIKGEAYFRGMVGERFAVRNSGAQAVVEGTGDHGCEYMTGGTVVVLGRTGRNFAAGMSGGEAYVYDVKGNFAELCNQSMVGLESVETEEDQATLKALIEKHVKYTRSTVGKQILENWTEALSRFVKVMPREYKRVLEEMKQQQEKVANG
ncbi:glutamate synthase (NADH) large subunit [Magnetococcus marinus MC-1]|uniref:Glutamate synthase [NADPH] large chain n=1 Tax=Magnetococcus marinus (strain ATCC BAA-1437 / JCM 17883 / MC-1) TaxID=156889 RepID=A0L5I4_MAGMM|nr:glutamate synthase large subunit [Magnetococcus marinus]ABK43227.1 glutamate synthase (NADH) large subunit [Magnetococcus marinus MC-1]